MTGKRTLFFGADSQVGTTMAAQSAAELLAERGRRVLLVRAGSNPGNEFMEKSSMTSVEDLREWLAEESLTAEVLRRHTVTNRGVDILPGVRSWQSSRYFEKNAMEQILSLAEMHWDYLVVDGGSGGPDSLGYQALRCCSRIFLVATQQEKTLFRYGMRSRALKKVMTVQPWFLVNKFNDSGAFYTQRQMAGLLECEVERIRTAAYAPYGWQAELEHATLLGHRSFRKDMKAVTDIMEAGGEDGI